MLHVRLITTTPADLAIASCASALAEQTADLGRRLSAFPLLRTTTLTVASLPQSHPVSPPTTYCFTGSDGSKSDPYWPLCRFLWGHAQCLYSDPFFCYIMSFAFKSPGVTVTRQFPNALGDSLPTNSPSNLFSSSVSVGEIYLEHSLQCRAGSSPNFIPLTNVYGLSKR